MTARDARTSRARILRTAKAHGWSTQWTAPDVSLMLTRGPESVYVTFSDPDVNPRTGFAKGQRVRAAYSTVPDRNGVHSATRGMVGTDKTGQVIDRLSVPRAIG